MSKALILVESPAKARTIQRYVGKDYKVLASVGHIKDLPKSKLGVDIQNGFEPVYEIIRGKAKIIQQIKKAAREVKTVFLALDPDREGEAIAAHLAEEVEGPGRVIYRALFNEVSKDAVLHSLSHPTELDRRKVEAQVARRVLDRLVGYEISPMLWKKVRRGLSAGRVQSVAVRLVCERYREIEGFTPEEYWSLTALLEGSEPPPFEVKLIQFQGGKIGLRDEADARRVEEEVKGYPFRVRSIKVKETRRNPPPPFTTSKLQQEAYRRLRFSAKKTMALAQQLYEGIDLGKEGAEGLITYMRTDSVRVADQAIDAVRSYIRERFGSDYLPARPNVYRSRKGAQEAHEAIRPTKVDRYPEQVRQHLSEDQYSLYRLIWERFVASQMRPALYERTSVDVEAGPYLFRGSGAVMTFPGFTALYGHIVDGEGGEEEGRFPELRPGQDLKLLKLKSQQHFTQPPPPFTEASLVKELEERGIGRPSTYATILSNIQERGYVTVEKGVFRPTELGLLVTDLLVQSFPGILDVNFTAGMEEKLDLIEDGQADRLQVLKEFYTSFREDYVRAETRMADLKREGLPTEFVCERCQAKMVVKVGKKGPFLSCSSYPSCTYSRPYMQNADAASKPAQSEEGPERCPKCGAPMVLREGRFGRFYGCARYPECRGTAPPRMEVQCPEEGCDGQVVEKRSRKGRAFYGCSNYPKCQFALWERPVPKPCPQCNAPFMVERSRASGLTLACYKKGCGYTVRLADDTVA